MSPLTLSRWRRDLRTYCKRAAPMAAAGALLAAITGCEAPLFDRTDADALGLIAQRQRETLGATSDARIQSGNGPFESAKTAYRKVPPTVNEILPQDMPPAAPLARRPASQPSATVPAPATTPSTTTAPAMEALMANLPGIDLDNMPELPAFPRPAPAGKTRQVLNLDDSFNRALAHNRDYMTRKEDLFLAAINVSIQRHVFDPLPYASTTAGVAGKGESSDYAAAFEATQTIGVRQRLPYGGDVVAEALASSVQQVRQSVETGNSSDLAVSLKLPLLRRAGTVAQEDLLQAERAMVYQVREFERYRRGFLVTVAAQYFSLLNQRAQIVNRFTNVRSFIFITQRSKALFEAGLPRRRSTLLDVMRAAQSEFQARSSLISAIEQYEIGLDRFKMLLGISVDEPIDLSPQYFTTNPPQLSESQAVAIALKLRLDLQTARDQVDDARRGVKIAGNNLLPDLDLNATARIPASADRFEPRGENLAYSAGVSLSLPLDQVNEKAALRSAKITVERAKRNVTSAASQVETDVRAALRAIRQQQIVLAIQKNNIELAQKRKAFSDIQFRNGAIDNRDYLDAETALLDAQNNFARALSDLKIAILQYLRDTDQLRVDFSGRLVLPADAASAPLTTAPASQPAIVPKNQN